MKYALLEAVMDNVLHHGGECLCDVDMCEFRSLPPRVA